MNSHRPNFTKICRGVIWATFFLFSLKNEIYAQTNSKNTIATSIATAPISDPNTFGSKPLSDVKKTIQYFDGLGRLVQTVIKQGSLITTSGATGDLITQKLYYHNGRDSITFLPYAASSQDGSFQTNAVTAQSSWYSSSSSPIAGQGENAGNAITKVIYDNSPLNRVTQALAPGNSWVGTGKGVQNGYWNNTAKDSVRIWNINLQTTLGSGFITSTSSQVYGAGQLYKNITTDEAGHQVIAFTDLDGHTVLKKVQLTAAADNGSGSGHTGWLCTYYVYDDLGDLRCVIQPQGVQTMNTGNNWSLTTAILSEQCFRYEYDQRNRMIMKQVPGTGTTYMVYDARDRAVMTQDAVLHGQNNWVATKYDSLNRPILTWMYGSGTATFSTITSAANASISYPDTGSAPNVLTRIHYDNYNGVPAGLLTGTYRSDWNSYLNAASTTTFPYPVTPTAITATSTPVNTNGQITWTQSKILSSSPTAYLTTVNIYDDKGRAIQAKSSNITGGADITTTQYTWAGQPLIVVTWQQKLGTRPDTTIIVARMTYDNLNRLVKTEMRQSNTKVNNGAMTAYATISQIQYDALGQVQVKMLGNRRSSATVYSTAALETQGYEYNIRGWLLGVNRAYARDAASTDSSTSITTSQAIGGEMFTESSADIQSVTFPSTNYFGFDLGYDKTNNNLIKSISYTAPQYTGNITGMVWKGANDKKVRKYDFTYDAAGRLTAGNFGQFTAHAFTNATVNYNASGLTYDYNGNILSMNQYGVKPTGASGIIDQLTYHYTSGSNKLLNVADASNDANSTLGDFHYPTATKTATTVDYTYDVNGNMLSDANKNISSIVYNYLNLPQVITVTGKGTITYVYDASGNKLQKKTAEGSKTMVTTYIGGSVYQNDTLQFFGTNEGRARANAANNGWDYDYFLKDHLGNTRMVITDDYNVASPILEATSYYPFGLQQKGIGLTASLPNQHNKYLFNEGTELQEDFNIDLYSTDYRSLDPQLGRFWQIDPDAESTEDLSPFNDAANNPILINDPMGLDTLINTGQKANDGTTIYQGDGTNQPADVVITAISSSSQSSGMSAALSLAATTIAAGGGPEDPVADLAALMEMLNAYNTAMDLANTVREMQQQQQLLQIINSTPTYEPTWLKSEGNSDTAVQNKPSSPGKMQQEVRKKQAPNDVKRVDNAHIPTGKPHVHYKDGTSSNNDGTIHDAHKGTPNPSNRTIEWLKKHNWTPPQKS